MNTGDEYELLPLMLQSGHDCNKRFYYINPDSGQRKNINLNIIYFHTSLWCL